MTRGRWITESREEENGTRHITWGFDQIVVCRLSLQRTSAAPYLSGLAWLDLADGRLGRPAIDDAGARWETRVA